MKRLFLFTATFPFGTAETFLETEITYLAKSFIKVTIIPLTGQGNTRVVPKNCEVLNPIIKSKSKQYLYGLLFGKSLPLFITDFFSKKVYCSINRIKQWFIAYVLTNNLLHNKSIKLLIKDLTYSDIVYFYWGKGGCYLSPYLKNKVKMVARFHGEWDLWEESSGGYAPLRKLIAKSLSLAVFISETGECYFKQRYPFCNTIVSRLGSADNGISKKSSDKIFRILSCSLVYPLKRVPLIYEALQLIDNLTIEWTHIGGGRDFKTLMNIVRDTKPNISVNLLGQLSNQQVMQFYQNNPVDLFINVSTNEGIPVSIMEAISFNVPIIGTDVGGNSEIVTTKTGFLIPSHITAEDLAKKIISICNNSLQPRNYWSEYYNAENNYRDFAEMIHNL